MPEEPDFGLRPPVCMEEGCIGYTEKRNSKEKIAYFLANAGNACYNI
jgi:hypothetical protein